MEIAPHEVQDGMATRHNTSHMFFGNPSTKEFVDNLLGIAFESDVPTAEFVELKGKRFRIERVQATSSRFQTGDCG